MNPPTFSLCVYCGSRLGVDARYAETAQAVGQWIGERGGRLVYGGGRNGLMGVVADATLAAGGTVLGIIPQALVEREWAHADCTELVVVDTMHERKRRMADAADAFVAKPVGLLNTAGCYDGLCAFLAHTVANGFVSEWQMDLIRVNSDMHTLLPMLVQDAGFSPKARTDRM